MSEERKPSEEARERDQENAVRYMMADRRGRHFLEMLMAEAGVDKATFNTDPGLLAMCEGRRQVGLWARDYAAMVSPVEIIRMMDEARQREQGYENLDKSLDENEGEYEWQS